MAAPELSLQGGSQWTHTVSAGAGAITMELPALPAPTLCWVIDSIWIFAIGTVTVFDVNVTTGAGSQIGRAGGQVGGATNGSFPAHLAIVGPLVCLKNDQTKIVLTATGATSVRVTANCHTAAAN